jgi:stearoyl-CoA desaturase (delta-9 desaturase)
MTVWTFVTLPSLVLVGAILFAKHFGLGPTWLDFWLAVGFFFVTCAGIGTGYHRHFTHGAFRAKPVLRVVLGLAGHMAGQGSILRWVADHRRHHAFSDREGDPHSPWLFGTSPLAVARGFWHAHMGWLFGRDQTNAERFAPDLAKDRLVRIVDRFFIVSMIVSLGSPALIGWLVTGTWQGTLSAFLWAGLARFAFLHHVTWSINSICHMVGERPFKTRDKAANFWPLAILSMGESWHNLHHADPTCARHGVMKGQIDGNARLIWIFEKLGLAYDVRWPTEQRLKRLAVTTS